MSSTEAPRKDRPYFNKSECVQKEKTRQHTGEALLRVSAHMSGKHKGIKIGANYLRTKVRSSCCSPFQEVSAARVFSLSQKEYLHKKGKSPQCGRELFFWRNLRLKMLSNCCQIPPPPTKKASHDSHHNWLLLRTRDGTRTRTDITAQRILSPSCLPFHHPGMPQKKPRLAGLRLLSERRGSNPRPRPWQGRALPAELLSLIFVCHFPYFRDCKGRG